MPRSAVFYDPRNPSAGAIAESFEIARRATPSPRKKAAITSAQKSWHANAAAVRTPGEITAMALDAADQMGVLDTVISGLVQTGVLPSPRVGQVPPSDEPGYFETGVELAREAGSGAKDIALRAGAGAERLATTYIKEAGETIRTGPGGETMQNVAKEGSSAFGDWTAGQVVLLVAGFGIGAWALVSIFGGKEKRQKKQQPAVAAAA